MSGGPGRSIAAAITAATGWSGAAAARARVRSAVVTEAQAWASREAPSAARKRAVPDRGAALVGQGVEQLARRLHRGGADRVRGRQGVLDEQGGAIVEWIELGGPGREGGGQGRIDHP